MRGWQPDARKKNMKTPSVFDKLNHAIPSKLDEVIINCPRLFIPHADSRRQFFSLDSCDNIFGRTSIPAKSSRGKKDPPNYGFPCTD
jgi:hypothetical protein